MISGSLLSSFSSGTSLVLRGAWRWLGKLLLASSVLAMGFLGGLDDRPFSEVDLVVLPLRYSVVGWELSNLPDKWLYQLGSIWRKDSGSTREVAVEQVQEYFRLGLRLNELERQLVVSESAAPESADVQALLGEIKQANARRRSLHSGVEVFLESEVAAVLQREGIVSSVVFPPVDAVYTSSPHIMVFSPRDRIERQRDILLSPGLTPVDKESVEDKIAGLENVSVYIADTGGVAVYPSVVVDRFGLNNALEITAHEWVHHWLFFRPLGRHFWDSPDMTSLNETVATVAGQELGDLLLESLTGEKVIRNTPAPAETPDDVAFDFRKEMRETRLRAEELLAGGKVEEAEAYMESRRMLFVENGYPIRKLNQAYFAFHGTYATSAASVSPIGDQVLEMRDRSASIAEFLDTMANFASYQEFVDYLEEVGVNDEG